MIVGTIYGVVLNDQNEINSLGNALAAPPYNCAPREPVLYIKPRGCVAATGASVALPPEVNALAAASTIAMLLGRDAVRLSPDKAMDVVAAACVGIDLSIPHSSYYRPAIAQRCRDRFLPLGPFGAATQISEPIVTLIDGKEAHRWSPDRLVRSPASLIAQLSSFMTLRAGDLLMVGIPGDPPLVRAGQRIEVSSGSLPHISVQLVKELT